MIEIFYLFIILLFSFIIQAYPRYKNPEFGIDLYRWLLYAREIRNNNHKLPKYIDKYIIKARFSYPFLLLWIMSFFSQRFLEKYNYFINTFFTILENFVVFLFTYHLTNNLNTALLSSLVYASTAANIIENIDFSTRSFGQFIFTLSLISLYFYIFEGYSIWWFVIINTILLISHRMSFQALVFAIVSVSILVNDYFIFLSLFLSMAIAIIVTKGHYYYIFKGHIVQVYFWYKQITQNKDKIKLSLKDFVLSILSRNLFIALAVYLAFTNELDDFNKGILTLFVILFIVAIITTFIKPLRCIGEGYRYINYTTPIVSVFIAKNIQNYWLLSFFLILSLLPALNKQYKVLSKKNDPTTSFKMTDSLQKFLDEYFEKNKDKEVRFMSYPPTLDDFVAYRYKNAKVMFHDNGLALEKSYIPPFNLEMIDIVLKKFIVLNNIDIFITNQEKDIENYKKIKIDNFYIFKKEKNDTKTAI